MRLVGCKISDNPPIRISGVNILPNKWIRHPGTITDFLGLWVELLLARSADSNSAQRPKIRYLYNDVTTSNSTLKFLTNFFSL
mgnify:CR=1 FL=1